jgi:class 3 adenylate cyclase/tetratricopeptide (TPR) repeat protein
MTAKSTTERQSYLSTLCRCIPYHIVEEVLANPSEAALKPQTFDGSVLVLDLVGFSAMCQRLASAGRQSLSRLSTILDDIFSEVEVRAVFPFKGYVVQFAGDAMLSVFKGEGHEARCVAAALSVKGMMDDPAFRARSAAADEPLLLRMGVTTGTVHLSVMGDMAQRVVICAGPAPHRAIAHQLGAEPGEIITDHRIVERLGDQVEWVDRPRDRVAINGLGSLPPTHEVDKLEGRIEQQVEQKIALLEPFVVPPMVRRLKSVAAGRLLQGEIRRTVIQFVDFEGLTEGFEQLELAGNLARSQLRAVRKYDGVVLKVVCTEVGHRMMVLHGLQRPSENDVEHAVLAALEGITRLKAFLGERDRPLRSRVGIHLGDLYLGAIGSQLKHDLTAVGDTVNAAVRLAESAGPFEVIASEAVIQAIGEQFTHSERDAIRVKGTDQQLATHAVHAPAPGRAHYVQRRSAKRLYAGRADQIDRLHQIVDRALKGSGRIVGITGHAGSGKSHLLADVIDRWVEGGGIGVVGRCRRAARSTPLAPVIEMFSTYFGISPADDEATRLDHIRSRLAELELSEGFRELMALFQPVSRPDGLSEALIDLADLHARERVLDAILHFIEHRLSQVKPLYVLEDAHLADTLTLQLIQRVGALTRDRAYVFIATYRPEEMPDPIREGLDEELALEDLTDAEVEGVACHEMNARTVDPQLKEFLWRRTRGNPQHLVELIRFLAERLLVNVKGGTVVPAEPGLPLLEDAVPDSWHHVALARLDGLGEPERRLLRAASAIGSQFDIDLLDRAAELRADREALEELLSGLKSQQLIADDGGRHYRFRDETVRAIAYSLIPEAERREVHRRIADALERRAAQMPQGIAAALAHHRERAEQWSESARWYQEGLRVAVEAGLDREAYYLADRFEAVASRATPDAKTLANVAVMKLLATARQGSAPKTMEQCQRIADHHQSLLSGAKRSVVELVKSVAEIGAGSVRTANERLRQVYNNPESSVRVRCDAAYLSARLRYLAGDGLGTRTWLERGRELLNDDAYREAAFQLLEGDLLVSEGRFEPSLTIFNEVREAALKQGRQQLAALAMRSIGTHALLTEDFEKARRCLHYALTLDRRSGRWLEEAEDILLLGQTHLWNRDHQAARPHLERALIIARDIGHELVRACALVHLGAVVALSENPAEGQRMCEEGHQLASQFDLRQVQMAACLHLLRIALAREDQTAARELRALCGEFETALFSIPLYNRELRELHRRLSSKEAQTDRTGGVS